MVILRLILISVLTGLLGCSPEADGKGGFTVAAGLFPLAEAARAVVGPRGSVVEVVPPGSEPHDAELEPGQVDLLLDADVTVTVAGVQPAVDDTVASRDRGSVVIEHDGDPHVWLDPVAMARIGDRIAATMSEADPAGARAYGAAASRFRRRLEGLDRSYREVLSDCGGRTIVVAHAAFSALERYGLRQESIAGSSPEAEPSPSRLAELADLMRREGIATVFTEPLAPSDVADTLAREVGARTAVLDPIEAVPPGSRTSYFNLMERNLRVLGQGLGC